MKIKPRVTGWVFVGILILFGYSANMQRADHPDNNIAVVIVPLVAALVLFVWLMWDRDHQRKKMRS